MDLADRRRRALALRLAVALAAALALAGAAAAGPGGPHGPPGGLVERHAERLGLDDATRQALSEIVRASGERSDALREEIDAAHEHIRALLSEAEPDPAAVMQAAEELGALRTEAYKNRLRAVMDIHALLTPAQRQALVRLREEEGPHRGRHGRRGGKGACAEDRGTLCAGAEGAAAVQCYAEHWEALSPRCRERLERLEGR